MKAPNQHKLLCRVTPAALLILATLLVLWHLSKVLQPTIRPTAAAAYHLQDKRYSYAYPIHLLPAQDYHTLADYPFTYHLLPPTGCTAKLLILVHSAPGNSRRRTVIRDTWGGNSSASFTLRFVVGAVEEDQLSKLLAEEQSEHGDLVQGSYLDSYRNLTYKHLSTLKYAIYHCGRATYVLKTDDDVFVNTPALLTFISARLSDYGAKKLLFCNVKRRPSVMRTYRSKWRVTFGEYPHRTYPDYCPGWVVMYSPDVVFGLYAAGQISPPFWIDDVHVTGILAEKIGVRHTDASSYVLSGEEARVEFLFGRYDLGEEEIRRLWKAVTGN